VKPSPRFARRAVVKAHYYRVNNAYGIKAARLHLKYLKRDGVRADGGPGELYDATGTVTEEDALEPRRNEQHQFRFVVSPEDGHSLDLTRFTRALMDHMETDLGRKLEWAAVNHYNTDHPHSHIVIRGVDRAGRELRIDETYLQHGIRRRASEIATAELGQRTSQDLERQLDSELRAERFTSIDRELQEIAQGDVLALPNYPEAVADRRKRARLVGRLVTLQGLALARATDGSSWQLRPGWTETLRELGTRGDIVKRLHAHVQGDPTRYSVFPANNPKVGDTIEGIMRGRGLHDELRGTYFVAIETLEGRSYYVPSRGPTAESLRQGEIVKVQVREDSWTMPADRFIADVAAANGGIYTPEAHSAALPAQLEVRGSEDGTTRVVTREEFVASAVRRLYRLNSWKVVVRSPGEDRWTIPGNLIATLRQWDVSKPRTRAAFRVLSKTLLEEQVHSVGPAWLDSKQAQAAGAPYGFGAAVAEARAKRRQVLERRGLSPNDPKLFYQLRDNERLAYGLRIQQQLGIFLPEPPAGFSGKVERIIELQSGQRVFVVHDGRRFIVRELGAREQAPTVGQEVVVAERERQRRGHRISRE
jgi:type IV secretory pathway VirD2 relaxase